MPGGHEPRLKRQRRIAEAMALPGMRLDPALFAPRYTCSTQPAPLPLPSPPPHASSKTAGLSVEQQSSATKTTVTDEGNEVSPQQSSPKSTTTSTDVFVPDSIFTNYVLYLKEQSDLIEHDTTILEQQRLRTLQKQTQVWKAYLHGLTTISQLGDLRHAPDAIMPNNFG